MSAKKTAKNQVSLSKSCSKKKFPKEGKSLVFLTPSRIDNAEKSDIFKRISYSVNLSSTKDSDFVIEAANENFGLKKYLYSFFNPLLGRSSKNLTSILLSTPS